jgi:hypothetical protein
MTNPSSWAELVQPIVGKFRVGAAFGYDVVYNPQGCDALAKLLTAMAAKLDLAVERELAENPTPDEILALFIGKTEDGPENPVAEN